jgi:hypothetical protein
VTARQADDGDVQVANPMLLSVALPLDLGASLDAPAYDPARRRRVCTGKTWSTRETARFVVDKARVTEISIARGHNVRRREVVLVEIEAGSGWFRQDLDITTRLLRDGVEVRRHFEDDLTVGNQKYDGTLWAGASAKILAVQWDVKEGEWASWFEGASKVELEVKVAVDDD